jgi:hypothetical protein
MRSLPVLALALSAFVLSGCVGASTGTHDTGASASVGGLWGGACPTSVDQAVARTASVLLPEDVDSDRPQVSIQVLEGQMLVASAVWRADLGEARVLFDGPGGQQSESGSTWSSTTTHAPAGEYTLGLAGAPLAQGVSYTLSLVATGCPQA